MLGLVAVGKRDIGTGKDYEHHFPAAENKEKYLTYNGTNFDTLDYMAHVVRTTLPQTAKIAKALEKSSLQSTCKAIFDFVYGNYQYKQDDDRFEELRSPARAWKDRKSGVDCDCYAITISSILTNLGIHHAFKMAGYKKEQPFQHVYIVVPKNQKNPGKQDYANRSTYIVIDPVLDTFDYEKPPINVHLKIFNINMKMNRASAAAAAALGFLNGIEEDETGEQLLGLDGRRKRRARRKARKVARKEKRNSRRTAKKIKRVARKTARRTKRSARQEARKLKRTLRRKIRTLPKSQRKTARKNMRSTARSIKKSARVQARTNKRTAKKDARLLRRTTRKTARTVKRTIRKNPVQVAAKIAAMKKALAAKRAAAKKAAELRKKKAQAAEAKRKAAARKVVRRPITAKPVAKKSATKKPATQRSATQMKKFATQQRRVDSNQNKQIKQLQRRLALLKLHNQKIAAMHKMAKQNKAAISKLKTAQQISTSGVRTLAPKEANVRPLYNSNQIQVNAGY